LGEGRSRPLMSEAGTAPQGMGRESGIDFVL
jgi:hypothetical protein